jgi:ATP-dependent DNA helicase RecQ
MTPHEVLKKHWGYDEFRPCQLEIIQSVLDGHDTLGLLPTGGGKSITFQVPAMMLPGLTVVVTPLVSLMKDQVDNLRDRNIRGVYIYSGLTRRELTLAYDRCRLQKAKLLYVSPERLRSQSFIDELRRWQVSLIVVDEAHCISQWGYDFRPSYLKIIDLRKVVGEKVPVLALTASATPVVRDDIMARLNFGADRNIFTLSFDRSNLSYVVRQTDSKIDKLLDVLHKTSGTAIVYVRSRVKTRQIADALIADGISASFYHAGLDVEVKADRQEKWKSSQVRVMVATNAFGMGIDKPDVRVVVHMDVPPSLEEYYQEAGRAGRDGKPAFAVILASATDKGMLTRRLNEAFPDRDYIRRVYELVGNFLSVPVGEGYNKVFEFDINKFCAVYNLQPGPVRGALALLTQANYIEFVDEAPTQSRMIFLCRRDELYTLNLDENEDRVLMAIMRLYTGLFSEYVYISESRVAAAADVNEDQVYQAMLALSRMHVLHYVPRKAIPYIYYTTSRELPKHVVLPPQVYEDRRRLMEHRLNAIRRFVFGYDECRSKVLLEYFGETDVPPCGRCDVCRSKHYSPELLEVDPAEAIRRLAAEPDGIDIDELSRVLRIKRETLTRLLRNMVDLDEVIIIGTRVYEPVD